MSKHHKPTHPVPPKKPAAAGGDNFTYLWRNGLIVLVLAIFLFGVDNMNKDIGQLEELSREFSQLRQNNSSRERMEELYGQIMEIQNDTSFLKRYTRGYYWAIHDMAIKGKEYAEELKEKAPKPMTREEKFAMRIGIWPLIDYVNKNTPDSAVIYLPAADSALTSNSKWNYAYDPEWMEYFLYPRLCLSIGREKDQPMLADRVTHVIIVEGKGYEKLKYEVPVDQRAREAVLPIDHPPVQNQQ